MKIDDRAYEALINYEVAIDDWINHTRIPSFQGFRDIEDM